MKEIRKKEERYLIDKINLFLTHQKKKKIQPNIEGKIKWLSDFGAVSLSVIIMMLMMSINLLMHQMTGLNRNNS